MYITEQTLLDEEEYINFMSESFSSKPNIFKEKIVDPIISTLGKSKENCKRYIAYGESFLSANAEMLAKEYPTKAVTYPRRYIDDIFDLFGFNKKEFAHDLKECLNSVNDKTNWLHIMHSQTNVIHSIVLYYSDMILDRRLRDSARQQLALTCWQRMYGKYWPAVLNESVMAYTYSTLNNTWGIVRSENMINWITEITETGYSFYRPKLDLNMSIKVVVDMLNRIRNDFNQTTRLLANRYKENIDAGNMVGDDVDGSEAFFDTKSYETLRNGLMLLIKNGDKEYWTMGDMYKGVARWKNVDVDTLYEFATKTVKTSDISNTMDLIFYVFLSKEGNSIKDINSVKYINRITNFPTAIDRAIQGRPYVKPMMTKYKAEEEIVRTFVCLIATYILTRINDVKSD